MTDKNNNSNENDDNNTPSSENTNKSIKDDEDKNNTEDNNTSDEEEDKSSKKENKSDEEEDKSNAEDNNTSDEEEDNSDEEEDNSDEEEDNSGKKENKSDEEKDKSDEDENKSDEDENKSDEKENKSGKKENKSSGEESNMDSDIDLFNSNDIVIKEKVSYTIVDDNLENEIYLNDLQNQLLSEYPLYKQSAKYIQDIVYRQAMELIELKSHGREYINNKYNNNNIIENYANNNFNQFFMIPIVSDIKIKYKTIDAELNAMSSNDSSGIHSNKDDSVYIENFKKQLQKLAKLEDDLKWDKLSKIHQTDNQSNYNIYIKELYKLLLSYKQTDKPGYKTYINNDSKLLRHHNIDGLSWELRRGISGYYYTVYNPVDDVINDVEVHKGEYVNIVGFFKLPLISNDIYDVLNSTESLHRYGKIGNITNIEIGNQTIITCENHGLEKDDYIYIEDSNSKPKINSSYIIAGVIDKNKITIETDIQKGVNGDKGVLYSLLKLSYRVHDIVKVNTSFKLQKDKTIINESKNRLVGDVYLLNNEISTNEYIEVLKNIIPTYYEIITSLVDNKSINYIDDIDVLLQKYDFKFSDLNIKETNIFKKLLKDTLVKTDKIETKTVDVKNKSTIFNNKDTDLYKTDYITHANIKPYYGTYPLLKSPFDTVSQRIQWVTSSYDNGQLYYDNVLSILYEESISKYKIGDLKDELKKVEKDLQTVDVDYEKEKKIVKYTKTDPCDLYKKTVYPTYTSIDELMKDTDEDDINKKALVIDDDGKNLYKYNGKDWIKDDTKVSYDNVEHLCNFDNIDIDKLDISKLHCIYLSSHCKNKKLHRLDEKMNVLKSSKNSIESLIDLMTGDGMTSYFKDKIDKSKKRLFRLKDKHKEFESIGGAKNDDSKSKPGKKNKTSKNSKKKNKNKKKKNKKKSNIDESKGDESNGDESNGDESKGDESNGDESNGDESKGDESSKIPSKKDIVSNTSDNDPDSIDSILNVINTSNTGSNNSNNTNKSKQYEQLLNKIFNIEDINERKYYIYELIERDGLLINSNIYSKSHGVLIICGHWKYIYKLSKTPDENERDKITNEMYSVYGDNGAETQNKHTCKTCSQTLGTTEYDEFDGGTDGAGNLVQSRLVWNDNIDGWKYDKTTGLQKIDCMSTAFKEKLGLKGITSLQTVNKSVEICKYVSDISNNIGVELPEEEVLNINIDCLGKILDLLPENKYKVLEIKKLKEKGWDSDKIRKLLVDGDKFKQLYNKYLLVNKLCIITARLLITLQSNIPGYKITNPTSACAYNGIDGDKGLEYMSCILIAMKLFSAFFHKKTQEENIVFIKNTIDKKYSLFKNDKNIRKMLYKKQDYLDKIKEKTELMKEIDTYKIDDSITISDNFPEALKKQEKIIDDYRIVVVNIGKEINNSVKKYINTVVPIESGITESSCCYMKNENYYNQIRAHYTTTDKLITKASQLKNWEYLVLLNGFYSRYNSTIHRKYIGTPRFVHQIDDSDTNIIHDKFLFHCYSGEFIGEAHNFIGIGKMKKCTKCNMTYKNITDKVCSYKEFEKLQYEIGIKSMIKNKESNILVNDTKINEIGNKLAGNVEILMKILDKYNYNKDIYNNEYIINLGNYNVIYDKLEFKNDKDRILTEETRNSKRIELIKKYINQYFRKYISMIRNNQFAPLTLNIYETKEYEKTYDKMSDIIEIIKNENKQFAEYNSQHKEIFEKLEFNLSTSDIMNICYKPNKYSKDYSVIVEESKFTADDAISTLLNILVNNLIGMLEKKDEEHQRVISLFIFNVFDEIESESRIINTNGSVAHENDSESQSESIDIDSPLIAIYENANGDGYNDVGDDDVVDEALDEALEEIPISYTTQSNDDSLDGGDYGDMPQGIEDE